VSAPDITEFAPAKVNLTLRVGKARSDGYHPLDSLVVFADWGDEITVREADAIILSMSGEASWELAVDGDNLVSRAACALREAAGVDAGAMINLHKEIPVAAGLGGGSADAAATLRALNRFWNLGWSLDRLAQLAITLGADVPACIYSRPLRMRSKGEWVEVLDDFPPFRAVIINPGVPVSTAQIFRKFDANQPAALVEAPPIGKDVLAWLTREPNDLEAPAKRAQPEIGVALDWLSQQDDVKLARMSGSGASCFALFEDSGNSRQVAEDYPHFAVEVGLAGVRGGSLIW
jgi:4-diphosphocytidyl-2-C-methyl-D-erythritol kinase